MMHSFAKSKPTGEVIETHLKMKPEEFDKQFLAWLTRRSRTPSISFRSAGSASRN